MAVAVDFRVIEGINIDDSPRPIAFARKLGNLLGQAGYSALAQQARAYIDATYQSLFTRIATGDEHVLGREHFDAVAVRLGYTRSIGGMAFNDCVSPLHRNREIGNGDIKPIAGIFGLEFETITGIVRPIRRASTSLSTYPDEVSPTNRVSYDNAENFAILDTHIVNLVQAGRESRMHPRTNTVEACIAALGDLILSTG